MRSLTSLLETYEKKYMTPVINMAAITLSLGVYITSCSRSQTAYQATNTAASTNAYSFTDLSQELRTPLPVHTLAAGDFDNDGDMDLAVGYEVSEHGLMKGKVVFYENKMLQEKR